LQAGFSFPCNLDNVNPLKAIGNAAEVDKVPSIDIKEKMLGFRNAGIVRKGGIGDENHR
jgi:hypothetical protein